MGVDSDGCREIFLPLFDQGGRCIVLFLIGYLSFFTKDIPQIAASGGSTSPALANHLTNVK